MDKQYCWRSHKLAGAFAREIVRNGGMILDATQANKIIVENGQVTGVDTWEGRTLHSKVVISSLDPQSTFLTSSGQEPAGDIPEGEL